MYRRQMLDYALVIALVALSDGIAAKAQQSADRHGVRIAQLCTQDARQCPDGTWVSRVPPNCDFRPCRSAPLPPRASVSPPNAFTTANVNLRAGPETEYPVIVTVPGRTYVTIHACIRNYAWCDVGYRDYRGWMTAAYLQAHDGLRYLPVVQWGPRVNLPILEFDIHTYWPRYYRNQPFYAQISYYGQRPVGITPSVFYRPLSGYGSWVWLRGQYVWVPDEVGAAWRPYTEGSWVYTDRYGWYWVSDEPFGWATYHYGRWGYSDRIGWFWVPGTTWGPAWVTWRASDDYLGWAPLPPGRGDSIRIDISIGSIPDYYWQVVPSSSFLSVNIGREVIRDRQRVAPVLERTKPLGTVTVVNNVVVNNVVNVQYVEQKTNETVVAYQVASTSDPDQAGKVEGEVLQVLTATSVASAEPPADETPPAVMTIDELAAVSETAGQAGDQPTTEELVVAPTPASESAPIVMPGTAPPPPQPAALEGTPQPAEPSTPAAPEYLETPVPEAGAAPLPPPPGIQDVPSVVPEAVLAPAEQAPPPPPAQEQSAPLPPPVEPAPPAAIEAPPIPEAPAPEVAPRSSEPSCPEGMTVLDDGSCAPAS